jgi:hypothetical protein
MNLPVHRTSDTIRPTTWPGNLVEPLVGGWGSNPRPADHEKYGPVHREHYLHGYHRAGRTDLARRAHAGWVAELTGRAARDWTGPGAAAALRRLQHSQTDARTAIQARRMSAASWICPLAVTKTVRWPSSG